MIKITPQTHYAAFKELTDAHTAPAVIVGKTYDKSRQRYVHFRSQRLIVRSLRS